MVDVAVVDYGMGNLRSVEQAMRKVAPGAHVVITDRAAEVAAAGRVVFPGQGAMPDCIRNLENHGLRQAILNAAQEKPFLGICIGLQMLFDHSDEGNVPCLGIMRGNVVRFSGNMHDEHGNRLKVPHMGWNQVHHAEHPLWQDIPQNDRFYFVHSFYVTPDDESLVQATSDYPQPFVCAVARDNLFAVQFHPEKSHTAGLKLLENFMQWNP
jgi:glutamine amidotransferase